MGIPISRDSRRPDPVFARDEENLVNGLKAGEHAWIGAFLERTHHAVYAMSGRLTRDIDRRRDWTHDVLLGILDDVKGGRFVHRRPGSFWAWFQKRAYYRLLDACRRDRRLKDRETAGSGEPDAVEFVETWVGADLQEEMRRVGLRAAIESCLADLESPEHRRALELILFDDLAYEDVARDMKAPLNTVRSWIRRGRLALRRCLAGRLGLGLEEGL